MQPKIEDTAPWKRIIRSRAFWLKVQEEYRSSPSKACYLCSRANTWFYAWEDQWCRNEFQALAAKFLTATPQFNIFTTGSAALFSLTVEGYGCAAHSSRIAVREAFLAWALENHETF